MKDQERGKMKDQESIVEDQATTQEDIGDGEGLEREIGICKDQEPITEDEAITKEEDIGGGEVLEREVGNFKDEEAIANSKAEAMTKEEERERGKVKDEEARVEGYTSGIFSYGDDKEAKIMTKEDKLIVRQLQYFGDPNNLIFRGERVKHFVNKCFLCIIVCLLAEDKEHPELAIKAWAAGQLDELFTTQNITNYWLSTNPSSQAAILYGIMLLLGSSHQVILDEATAIMGGLLKNEMIRRMGKPSFSLSGLDLIRDLDGAKEVFQEAVKEWHVVDRELELKSLIRGVNIVVAMLKGEELEAIKGDVVLLISFFIMHLENISLLSYIVEALASVGGQEIWDEEDDYLFRRISWVLKAVTSPSFTMPYEEEICQKQLSQCFSNYEQNKKLLICSMLLRLMMENSEWGDHVIAIMVAIESMENGSRIWGLGATLLDRLIILLQNQKPNNKGAKLAILGTIYALTCNMPKVESLTNVMSIVEELTNFFMTNIGLELEVQELAGMCLLNFLDTDNYVMHESIYEGLREKLLVFSPPQALGQLTRQIKERVEEIVSDVLRLSGLLL